MGDRGPRHNPDLPGLKRMRGAAKPGECIACGDPAIPLSTHPEAIRCRARYNTKRTHQDTCGAPDCHVAWHRFWRRDQRAALIADQQAAAEPRRHHVIPRAEVRRRQSAGQLWRVAA